MSRGYRINWVTVATQVTTKDKLTMQLSLLGILPEGEMQDLLCDELSRDGWSAQADGTLTKELDGDATATLDPKTATVTVEARAGREVTARGADQKGAQQALTAESERARQELEARASRVLAGLEPDLRQKLGEAIQRVYLEALRKKAATMGAVESVREQRGADGSYEVTIKVRT